MQPQITIGIPFHQDLEYLRQAIDSVLGQSDPRWELLISDDSEPGSDGGRSVEVAALVAGLEDRRIRYVRHARSADMIGNWNHCIDSAHTPLVSLLHHDDRLEPDYVALMIQAAASHPQAVAFFCRVRIIDEAGKQRFSIPDFLKRFVAPPPRRTALVRGRLGLRRLLRGNFIFCPTLCFQKQRLGQRRFAPTYHDIPDWELTTRLLFEGEILIGLPDVAYCYRRHRAATTELHADSLVRFKEEIRLLDHCAALAAERDWPELERLARRKHLVQLYLLYRMARDLLRGRLQRSVQKARFLFGPVRRSVRR